MKTWKRSKWMVANMKGDSVHEVEATYARVTEHGALTFIAIPDACEPHEVVRAFSPGYWSQMSLVGQPGGMTSTSPDLMHMRAEKLARALRSVLIAAEDVGAGPEDFAPHAAQAWAVLNESEEQEKKT